MFKFFSIMKYIGIISRAIRALPICIRFRLLEGKDKEPLHNITYEIKLFEVLVSIKNI